MDTNAEREAAAPAGGSGQGLYTLAQLARIAGVPAARLRAWHRQGLLRAERVERRLVLFSFAQLTQARRLRELEQQAGLSPRALRRALARLRRWLPPAPQTQPQSQTQTVGPLDGAPGLEHLALTAVAGELLVRLPDGRLAEPSGQLRLPFAGERTKATVLALRLPQTVPHAAGTGAGATDEDPFERAVLAEAEGRLDVAAAAYAEALALGRGDGAAGRPEAAFNLGNVLWAQGRKAEAAQGFALACELDPEYVEAWNNLGNALADLGRGAAAVQAYRRALALAPHYADAHYNLAETLAARGDRAGAEHHWREYLARDPGSPWAARVRARLQDRGA